MIAIVTVGKGTADTRETDPPAFGVPNTEGLQHRLRHLSLDRADHVDPDLFALTLCRTWGSALTARTHIQDSERTRRARARTPREGR